MNLIIMVTALVLGAILQQVLPACWLLGQAKAPFVLSIVLYYALHRSLRLLLIAAIVGGVLCDSLEAMPMGYSALVFCVLGVAAWNYHGIVFSARGVTHMVFGFLAGTALIFGLYGLMFVSHESIRAMPWYLLALKAFGTAFFGMVLTPLVFALLDRVDRLIGNITMEHSV